LRFAVAEQECGFVRLRVDSHLVQVTQLQVPPVRLGDDRAGVVVVLDRLTAVILTWR
jgi:hypothetical protein